MSKKKDLYQAFKDGDDIRPGAGLFKPYGLILGGGLFTCIIVALLVLVTKFILKIGA